MSRKILLIDLKKLCVLFFSFAVAYSDFLPITVGSKKRDEKKARPLSLYDCFTFMVQNHCCGMWLAVGSCVCSLYEPISLVVRAVARAVGHGTMLT